jgi:hypothetical protein
MPNKHPQKDATIRPIQAEVVSPEYIAKAAQMSRDQTASPLTYSVEPYDFVSSAACVESFDIAHMMVHQIPLL